MPDIGNGKQDDFNLNTTNERQGRLEVMQTFTLSGGILFDVVVNNQASFNTLQEIAQDMIDTGDLSSTMPVKDSSGTTHDLTAPQVIDLYQQHADWFIAHYQAQWALIDLNDPLVDYTDDQYWPPNFTPSLGLAGDARWAVNMQKTAVSGNAVSYEQLLQLGVPLRVQRRMRIARNG